jgi:hypothetical protein
MAVVFGLEKLYSDVVSRFATEAPGVTISPLGWREINKQGNKVPPRIIWQPGDPEGLMGEILPPIGPGGTATRPRALVNLGELFTVWIHGWKGPSAGDVEEEVKQYHEARLLFDAWVRAVHLSDAGGLNTKNITLSKPRWVTDKLERRFGAMIQIVGAIRVPIPDSPYAAADEPLAGLNVKMLGQSETISITETEP